jgi:transcriptional regulator with XRE-family HTH domain
MPAPRIGPRRPPRIFLAEWRESRGLTQERLAERLGVSGMTVSRWERSAALLNTNVMAAIAEALDIEPGDLFHHPDRPSADALLRDQSPEVVEQALKLIRAIRN